MSSRNERWLVRGGDGELASRSVRAGTWATVAQVGRAVAELVATIVLARLVSPEEFGIVGMVLAIAGFLVLFKDLGLSTATIQRPKIAQSEVSSLLFLNVVAGLVLTAVCAGLGPVLAWFYGVGELVEVTAALSVTFALGALGVQHHALLRRQLAFGRVAAIEVAATVVGVVAGVVAAVAGLGYWALVVRAIAAEVVAGVGPWILCGWRPSRPRFDGGVRELASFGGNITAFGVVNYFARNLDDILIGRMFGAAELGFYQKAYELLMMPMRQINGPIGAVAIPALSQLDPSSDRYRRAYLRILEKLLLVTSFVGAFLCGTADWAVAVLLGERWLAAAPIFAWLGLLVFTQPLGNTISWLFVTQNRTDELLRWGFVGSGLAVASFIVGLAWGPLGVAASYAVTGVVIRAPALIWFVTRRGPVKVGDFVHTMLPYTSCGVGAVAAIVAFREIAAPAHPAVGLVGAFAIGLCVYAMFIAAIPRCRAAVLDAFALVRTAWGK